MEKRKHSTQTNLFAFLKKPKTSSSDENTNSDPNPVPCSSRNNTNVAKMDQDVALNQAAEEESSSGHSLDIGNYVNLSSELDDKTKYLLLKQCWEPSSNYVFPVYDHKNHKRKFQYSWLKQFPWLAYSHVKNGAFCKACVLFGKEKASNSREVTLLGLVTTPFIKYKHALECFRSHAKNQYHNANVTFLGNFTRIYENKDVDVSVKLQSALQQEIENNQKKLLPIIKTVIFCGEQNIPSRGHRDDGKLLTDNATDEATSNQGKFRALLKFRIEAGDTDLLNHMKTAPRNATYISKTIQNEIIQCCAVIIQRKIVEKIKKSVFFSILIDETTDVSVKEQMSLCVRYYDVDKCTIQEDFLAFIELSSCTGKALFKTVKTQLENLGLDIKNIRGQGYDGAANMSGYREGLQAHICKEQPLALYTHCFSHRLNLALCKACGIPSIRNVISTIKEVTNFIRDSALRMNDFINKMKESETYNHPLKKIKKMCETRWVEKHEALTDFVEIFPAIIDFLTDTIAEGNSASSAKANTLLSALTASDFLVSLFIASDLIKLIIPLSTQLQSVKLDICKAYEMSDLVIDSLNAIRIDCVNSFSSIFNKTCSIARKIDAEIKLPRLNKRQANRANYESENVEHYYRLPIFIPFLDFLISELKGRFSERHSNIIELWNLVPTCIYKINDEKFLQAMKFYENDIEDIAKLEGELKLWKLYWERQDEKPSSIIGTIAKTNEFFPTIHKLLHILAIIPVTSCSAERSFSSLRLLKTYLQSTMAASRLNGLGLLYIHQKENYVSPEEVLDKFSKNNKRKLQLKNMLYDDTAV